MDPASLLPVWLGSVGEAMPCGALLGALVGALALVLALVLALSLRLIVAQIIPKLAQWHPLVGLCQAHMLGQQLKRLVFIKISLWPWLSVPTPICQPVFVEQVARAWSLSRAIARFSGCALLCLNNVRHALYRTHSIRQYS